MDDNLEPNGSSRDELLQSLLKEYEIVSTQLGKTDERTIQFVGISITLLTSWSVFFIGQGNNFPIALAWLGPPLFLLVFAYLISIYYFHFNNIWIMRTLSIRINMMLTEPAHITSEPGLPSSVFFSTRNGNTKAQAFYALLVGGLVSLFFIIFYMSFRMIYSGDHLAGVLFVTLYGSITILELYSVSGLLFDLPNTYRSFLILLQKIGRIPRGIESKKLYADHPGFLGLLWIILPRPADVLAKGHMFWLGFITALVTMGLTGDRLHILNLLFRRQSDWKRILDVPFWAVFSLGILAFILEEILLQQAKLLWDDVRDVERDKVLLQNRARAVARGQMTISAAIKNLSLRWILANIFAFGVGGWPLLLTFLAITLHQMLYVLWAKPKARQYPLVLLVVLSFNVALRFISGAVVIAGSEWITAPVVLIVTMLFFYTFGGMAALWKIEAEYQEKTGKTVAIRPQSIYYLHAGYKWQHTGLLGAILFSAFLVVIQTQALSCQNSVVSHWYASCGIASGDLIYAKYDLFSAMVNIILFVSIGTIISFLIMQ